MSSEHKEKLQPQGEAVIFLVYKDGNVFLVERLKPESGYFGYTMIPGGKVESSDNSPEDAMIREVREEMGIKVLHYVFLDSFVDMSFSHNLRRHHAYLVDEFEGQVKNMETDKERFFEVPIDHAKGELKIASSRYIVEMARRELGV